MAIVYLIRNVVNAKIYVGYTSKSLNKRWSEHLSDAKRGRNLYFLRAIRKYGKNSFEKHILTEAADVQTAKILEQYFIRLYSSYRNIRGYNTTFGGEGVSQPTPETRLKLSNALRNVKQTPERIAARAAANTGKKRTKEFCIALGLRTIGKKYSAEHRQKLSEAHRGKKGWWAGKHLPVYMKKNLSELGKKLVGNKNPFFGKHHSAVSLEKANAARAAKRALRTPEQIAATSLKLNLAQLGKPATRGATGIPWTQERRNKIAATWAAKRAGISA